MIFGIKMTVFVTCQIIDISETVYGDTQNLDQ
jgi:hypothetical protein